RPCGLRCGTALRAVPHCWLRLYLAPVSAFGSRRSLLAHAASKHLPLPSSPVMNHLTLRLIVSVAATSVVHAQNVSLQALAVTPSALHAATEVATQNDTLPTAQQVTSENGSGASASVGLSAYANVSWVGPT